MNEGGPEPSGDHDATRPLPPASAGVLCPFCGTSQPAAEVAESGVCKACRNRMDPMARIATHNAMGPWFVRDLSNPFAPGCSYETLGAMCARGRVKLNSVVRGPTTQQFWRLAAHTPGVAVLLEQCHACAERVSSDAERCPSCEAELRPAVAIGVGRFTSLDDRQQLGLPPVSARADASDPHAALDELTQVLSHAGSARSGGGVQPGRGGAPSVVGDGGEGSGRVRLLGAGLVVAVLLLLGLAMWAVVLPALGVRTGVEEITGLGAARPGVARGGGSASGGVASARVNDAERQTADEGASEADGLVGDGASEGDVAEQDEASVEDAGVGVDPVEPAVDGLPEPGMTEHLRALHWAAISGAMDDLLALRAEVESVAREALGERGVEDAEFAERFPVLSALYAWVERAIAERLAMDALGVR